MYQLQYSMKQGWIYAPYILVEGTPIISDNNFVTKQMIKNRYSTTDINSDYFGIINMNKLLKERRLKINKIINKLKDG